MAVSITVNLPGTETYDADYPNAAVLPSIRSQDWKVNVDNISAMIMASSIVGSLLPFPTPTDPATCSLTGGTWTPPCIGAIPPNSKLGCESAGGTWNYDTSNLCIKITQNGKVYKSEGTLPTISENGREQLISFASVFNDANSNNTKDTGENMIPIGAASIGIYTDCTFTTKYNDTSSIPENEVQVNFSPNITLPTINW